MLVHKGDSDGAPDGAVQEPVKLAGEFLSQTDEAIERVVPEEPEDRSNFTVLMRQIRDGAGIYPFASAVTGLLELDDEEADEAVKYSLTELLRNVVQHSESTIGAIGMAQYFPKTRQIELVVADTGIGVREHLARTYPEAETDMQALTLAVLPHHSGTFGPRMYGSMKDNAGLGLFFVNEIAVRGSGGFTLCSGHALLSRWGDARGRRYSQRVTAPKGQWNGTFAFVQLQRGRILDFGGLLDVCRQLASEARDDPYLQALEFVDSIPSEGDVDVVQVLPFLENVEEAARVRDNQIIPGLHVGRTVVLDFSNVKVITQSFAHALFYLILKRQLHVRFQLLIANCRPVVKSAIFAVSSYARTPTRE